MFSFGDVIGQKEVIGHLKAEVEQGRTAHALLLTGPKGAGKLPLALALARPRSSRILRVFMKSLVKIKWPAKGIV